MSRPLSRGTRLLFTLGPLCGFGLILLVTDLLRGPGTAGFVASVAVGAFLGGGKLVILAGTLDQAPVGPWGLAMLVVYFDLAVAMVVLGGIHHLYRLPRLGQRIEEARRSGASILKRNPWLHRFGWIGLAGFIAVPFNGTGALVGAVVGRLLGLSRVSILTATASGSLVGSVALAFAGDFWADRINSLGAEWLLGVALVALAVALVVLWYRWAFGEHGEPGRSSSM